MYCTNCGTALDSNAQYCSHCGTSAKPAEPVVAERRLMRSIYDKKIAGVCGGLAEYMTVDPTIVRLTWVIATVCFPPLLLGYIAAWIVVPKEPPRLSQPSLASVPQAQ